MDRFVRVRSLGAGAPHGAVRYNEADAVVLVAVPRGRDEDVGAWSEWSGATAARQVAGDTFLGATLHECVAESSAYAFVVRTEMGAADDSAVEAAVAAARASAGEGAVVRAYKCAFNIEKSGTPAGALPAVREMAKKKAENEVDARSRLEKDGTSGQDMTKSGTV